MLGLDYNERVAHEMQNIPLSYYYVDKKHPAYHYIIANLEQRLSVTLKRLLPQPLFAAILASYYKLK